MLFAIKGEQAHQVMQCQVNILVQLIQTDNLKSNLDVMKSNFQNPCLVPTAPPGTEGARSVGFHRLPSSCRSEICSGKLELRLVLVEE